ncbi:MAG: hypothetical protein LBV29_03925 [Azoarcus sp.]|jgi:uncharacterized membrane protein|nr:hypothetical protein [Azoarcus sp.]
MDNQNDNQPYTPYAPPTADIEFKPGSEETNFIPGGRPVSMGNGFSWISSSWGLFKQQAITWIMFTLAYVGICILLSVIPVVGDILSLFIPTLIIAGVIYSCDLLRRVGSFTFGDLFTAFQRKTGSLMILCLIAFGLLFLAILLLLVVFASSIFTDSPVFDYNEVFASFRPSLLMILTGFIILVTWAMSMMFAPALVMMHDIRPFEALQMSLSACLKNLLPGFIFWVVLSVLIILSLIPLGLGLLVTIPMFFICYYTSYRSIFFDEEN